MNSLAILTYPYKDLHNYCVFKDVVNFVNAVHEHIAHVCVRVCVCAHVCM